MHSDYHNWLAAQKRQHASQSGAKLTPYGRAVDRLNHGGAARA